MDADDVVLVALVRQPRDLEIARTEHWYRIPARSAPRHLTQASYVAFYLTRAFGEHKWTIREYAPVRGHELVYRRDLLPHETTHPRADEAYYKLELGPLIELPRPIVSRRGRRLLFIWTTGAKFSRAVELNDLLGKNAADDALWDALKAHGIDAERQMTVRDVRARYRVDFWIPCARGNVAIALAARTRRLPGGKTWRALRFDETDLQHPEVCVTKIRKVVRELGNANYQYAH